MRVTPEISFRKTVTTGSTFQRNRGVTKLACLTYSTCSANSVCHFRGKQLCSSQQIQGLHSKPDWNYGGDEWTLGFLTFQTLAEILKETEPGPSFSQLDAWSPVSVFKRVWALLPYNKRPPDWKGMDPRPICEQAKWTDVVYARRGSPAWDRKWSWLMATSMFERTSNFHTFWFKVMVE